MCHSENIYGNKHKKTAGCSQTIRKLDTTGVCLQLFFYVYRPIVGKVQLAAPIKGMTDRWRELALVRPSVIPFIETLRVLPSIGCFICFC